MVGAGPQTEGAIIYTVIPKATANVSMTQQKIATGLCFSLFSLPCPLRGDGALTRTEVEAAARGGKAESTADLDTGPPGCESWGCYKSCSVPAALTTTVYFSLTTGTTFYLLLPTPRVLTSGA